MQGEKIEGRELFYLEQLHLGELKDTGKVEHLPDDLRRDIEIDMKKTEDELFERLPAGEFAEAVHARNGGAHESAEYSNSWWSGATAAKVLPLAAVAVFAVLIGIFGMYPSIFQGSDVPVERIKGMDPVLNIYRAEGERARLLDDKTSAAEADLLQLEYNAAGYPYGMILSIDGRGVVTLHYPGSEAVSPELDSGSVLLPYSYQLDDAPDFERFFFVVADTSFPMRSVLESARRLAEQGDRGLKGSLRLPKEFTQYSVTILKEEK